MPKRKPFSHLYPLSLTNQQSRGNHRNWEDKPLLALIQCTILALVPFTPKSIDEISIYGLNQDHIEL